MASLMLLFLYIFNIFTLKVCLCRLLKCLEASWLISVDLYPVYTLFVSILESVK